MMSFAPGQEKDIESVKDLLEGYQNSFWTCSISKLGYSGIAIISRIKPISVTYGLGISDHDSEGRLVTAEFDSFYLLSGYVPNSGDGLKRLSYRVTQWDPSLSSYMKSKALVAHCFCFSSSGCFEHVDCLMHPTEDRHVHPWDCMKNFGDLPYVNQEHPRLWFLWQFHLSFAVAAFELEKSKPVILTSDLNCAHQEIDIFNPAHSLTELFP
ncbi:hypothetical protein Ancab_010924 [Ancistrocladus abbreviatus]